MNAIIRTKKDSLKKIFDYKINHIDDLNSFEPLNFYEDFTKEIKEKLMFSSNKDHKLENYSIQYCDEDFSQLENFFNFFTKLGFITNCNNTALIISKEQTDEFCKDPNDKKKEFLDHLIKNLKIEEFLNKIDQLQKKKRQEYEKEMTNKLNYSENGANEEQDSTIKLDNIEENNSEIKKS